MPEAAAALLMLTAMAAAAQQPARTGVAEVSVQGVTVDGALRVSNGQAMLGNNSSVSAGNSTADVTLARGGQLEVCTGTTVHFAKEVVPHASPGQSDAGLMLSLDRGALEGHYTPGAFADEILTPDLRLLVSAPGVANFTMRVNASGDTCFDNAGADAPYVVASSLMNGGLYRIQPGQRVLFVHGSLSRVVDNEREPCGCPPDLPPASAQKESADNQFPLAVSEGLQPPPKLPGKPIVPEGQAHAQVTATLSSSTPPVAPPAEMPAPASAQAASGSVPPPSGSAARERKPHRGLFRSIGHMFVRIFGGD